MATTTEEAIAAFLAKGGSVTKVALNTRVITEHDMKYLVRGEQPPRSLAQQREDEYAENRAERLMETVCEAAHMGGSQAAIQALNDFNAGERRPRARGRVRDTARGDAEYRMRKQAEYNERWGVDY